MLAAALALALLAGCSGSATSTPDPRVDEALEKLEQLTERVQLLENRTDSDGGVSAPPSPGHALSAANALPTPTLSQSASTPTPHPGNSAWIQERLNAVITLYNLTESGAALLRSLDLRQMRGEPGFFGSYGFKHWAGVGEARPVGVIHEISHSYWGGFPVLGFPDLSWDVQPGSELSTAMERYHADILDFMAQPPDAYELFRQRLRNLPGLSSDNTEPLFHNVEADLVYGTGGDLTLVPPVLRKYWARFLTPGPFGTWYAAAALYLSLPDMDRADADKYLGFEHLDLERYDSLLAPEGLPDLLEPRRITLMEEERQRLFDLAAQFDLLLGDSQQEENFQFWRGYLRDKEGLHHRHPGYLASLQLPRAAHLARALDFLTGLAGLSPQDQAIRLEEELAGQPFLVNFLPALENSTLLEFFGAVEELPHGPIFQATASFVERLERFSVDVERVIEAGRNDPQAGAAVLEEILSGFDLQQQEDLRLFFDLFRDENPAAASLVARALDKDTVRRLMAPVPAQLRFILTPHELLQALDVTTEAQLPALERGVALMIEEPSGNFIIDEPFLDLLYEVIAARSRGEQAAMLQLLEETPFPLEAFIREQPAAAALLASDLDAALRLVRQSDPVLSPPARIVHRVINADPDLAASLVQALDERGETGLVVDSLAYLAYDKSRSEMAPALPISLEQDGRFFSALLDELGMTVLAQRLNEAFRVYGGRAVRGQVPPDFLSQYEETLAAAVSTLSDGTVRQRLTRIIEQAGRTDSNGG